MIWRGLLQAGNMSLAADRCEEAFCKQEAWSCCCCGDMTVMRLRAGGLRGFKVNKQAAVEGEDPVVGDGEEERKDGGKICGKRRKRVETNDDDATALVKSGGSDITKA